MVERTMHWIKTNLVHLLIIKLDVTLPGKKKSQNLECIKYLLLLNGNNKIISLWLWDMMGFLVSSCCISNRLDSFKVHFLMKCLSFSIRLVILVLNGLFLVICSRSQDMPYSVSELLKALLECRLPQRGSNVCLESCWWIYNKVFFLSKMHKN